MSEDETDFDDDLADATEEEIQEVRKQWKKCSKCKRYVYGHKGQSGKYCNLQILSVEELEIENNKVENERILPRQDHVEP